MQNIIISGIADLPPPQATSDRIRSIIRAHENGL